MDGKRLSKLLSYALRHRPDALGLVLDPAGWVELDTLVAALRAHGNPVSLGDVEEVVRTSDKQRFAVEGSRIRANQGHSVEIDLGLVPAGPPALLYHGTVAKVLPSIREQGLLRGTRTHVHLSSDPETAKAVGGRRGKPVVLGVRAVEVAAAGHLFFLSANGVWLVDHVPAAYLDFPD